jgi:hypothetical protein
MKLLRLLMVTLCTSAGLVVLTQVPAVACSCVAATTAEHVERADAVFTGTLTGIEQTNPGDDDVISSGDPVFYTFDVDDTFKGDSGDGVVESVRDGATCGLEGMQVDQTYVVFAGDSTSGGLHADLCSGTAVASPRLIAEVGAALSPATEPPTPTATEVPSPGQPVPTQVPSGVERAAPAHGIPAWAWFGGGVLLAALAGATAVRLGTR